MFPALFTYFLLPKLQYNSAKKSGDITNTYIFKDTEFTVDSQSIKGASTCTLKYSVIFKVMETSKYFFIYLNAGRAFIVDKQNIENGTFLDIRNKLISSVPVKKYIICKY